MIDIRWCMLAVYLCVMGVGAVIVADHWGVFDWLERRLKGRK